jgi:putative peptidoglycan lipid II flippase
VGESRQRSAAGVRLLPTMFRLAPWSLAVQVASLASSIALAQVLGAGTGTDAYFVGLSIPLFVYGVLLTAVRSGAVPPLTELASSDRAFGRASSQIVSAIAAASFLCSLLLSAAAVLILPPLLGGSEHFEFLTRITILELAPLGVLGSLTGALGAVLAVRRVFAPQVAVMAIEPLLKTALTLTLGDRIGAQALVIGNLVGSSAAATVLWRLVRREGVRIRFGRPLNTPVVRNALLISGPLLVSATVLQVNPLVDRTMAAGVGPGSVTSLELGLRLFLVPTALILSTLVNPLTATWAARLLETGWPAIQESLGRILSVLSMTLPPLVVLGFLLRHELVSIIYQGGAYPPKALHETGQVFGILLLATPAMLCAITLSTVFVIQRQTVFNMRIGVANVGLNVLLNWLLRPVLGVAGIALSTTLTLSILSVLYIAGVRSRWGGLASGVVRSSTIRIAASVAATTLFGLATLRLLPAASSRAGLLATVVIVGAAGLAAHAATIVSARRLLPRLATRLSHLQRPGVLEP